MLQKFFSNLSEKEKKLLYVAIGFVILAMLDRVFFGPVMSKLEDLDRAITETKDSLRRDTRFLAYRDHILKESEVYQRFFPKSQKTEEEIIADFLKNIEVRASKAGINLIQVKPSETKHFKGYVEYYANLDCEGPLEKVIQFMHSIDSSDELLKIVKLNMAPKRASAAEVTATMVVKKMIVDTKSVEEAKKIVFHKNISRSGGGGGSNVTTGLGGQSGGVTGGAQGGASGGGGMQGPPTSGSKGNGSSAPGGNVPAGTNVNWKMEKKGPEGETPQVRYEGDFSQRYIMKGKKLSPKEVKKQTEEVKPEEMEPIKPSVWEQLMHKYLGKEEE